MGSTRLQATSADYEPILHHPAVGNVLAIAAAVSFQFLCMILSIVGPAGVATPHYRQNLLAFLAVLFITMSLSGLAVYSKMKRRERDDSPIPIWSVGLLVVCAFILVALTMGLLKI